MEKVIVCKSGVTKNTGLKFRDGAAYVMLELKDGTLIPYSQTFSWFDHRIKKGRKVDVAYYKKTTTGGDSLEGIHAFLSRKH